MLGGGRVKLLAGAAMPKHFHLHLLNPETFLVGGSNNLRHLLVNLFHNMAIRADKQLAGMVISHMLAADIGIQAGNMVNEVIAVEEFQRTVGNGRLPVAKECHNFIGGKCLMALPDDLENLAAHIREAQMVGFTVSFRLG